MHWIEELCHELGEEVVLVSQKGHEHWGFEEGNTYKIVKNSGRSHNYGFAGVMGWAHLCSPASNYGWKFVSAGPLVVENE